VPSLLSEMQAMFIVKSMTILSTASGFNSCFDSFIVSGGKLLKLLVHC
jgi:hypothetical protein